MRQAMAAPNRPEEAIGERIRRLRRERGLSQRETAVKGVTAAHLSRIEAGQRRPSLGAVRALAHRLGVSVEYLERGVELSAREELDLALADVELRIRLDPSEEAEHELGALVRWAEREGEPELRAKARSTLGLAAAARGKPERALAELEWAVSQPLIRPDVHPEVFTTLVSVYRQLGRPADAAALCERALRETHPDDGVVRTMLATQLSHALSDLGEFERAERVLEEFAGDLEQADPYARARLHWSLARVLAMQDKRRLALRHMRRAIALLSQTEDTVRLARAHVSCAFILLWGGKTAGVAKHLRAAEALLPASADASDRGLLRAIEGLLAARVGRPEEAERLAEEALSLLPEHSLERATGLYAKALARSADRGREGAEALYEELLLLLSQMKLWREASAVASDCASMLAASGEPEHANALAEIAGDCMARARESARRARSAGVPAGDQ
jgi:transcriptional regulator with XRE-family HTH domain